MAIRSSKFIPKMFNGGWGDPPAGQWRGTGEDAEIFDAGLSTDNPTSPNTTVGVVKGTAPDKAKPGAGAIAGAASFGIQSISDVFAANDRALNSDIKPGQTTVTQGQSTGGMALSGAAKGAQAGAALGPVGAGVGAAVGLVTGLLGGKAERKRENKEMRQMDSVKRASYQGINLQANLNPYGTNDMFYAADGGQVPGQEVEKTLVDIEKGEILIDPITLEVLREYSNPNRYKRHAKDPKDESIGNFTTIEPGKVVISRKYADRYLAGDVLTKKSIVLEILKNQRNEPQETVANVPQAAGGMKVPGWPDPTDFLAFENTMKGIKNIGNVGTTGNVTDFGKFPNTLAPQAPAVNQWHPEWAEQDEFSGASVNNMVDNLAIDNTTNMPAEEDAAKGPNVLDKIKKWGTATNVARALNFVPTGYGLAKALQFQPEAYDENNQIDRAKAYVEGMETNPSIEASRVAINTAQANRNKMLNNINSPSARAEMAAGNADIIRAEGDLIQQANNFALDARNKKRGTLADLEKAQGDMRFSARRDLQDRLQQNAAKSRALIQTGLSEGVRNFGAQVMDDNKLRSLNTMLEYYKVDNDGSSKDTKAFSQAAMELLNKGEFTAADLELKFKEYTTRADAAGRPKGTTTKTKYAPKTRRNG